MTVIDPISLEVIKNAFASLADEMALVIMRTAYSPIVRDSQDYSTAVCDWQGRLLAQGLTNPVHLGSFPIGMRLLLERHGDTMGPGDIFIFNDPYCAGGMHLPDVYVIKPVFVDGRREGFAATLVHHCDLGGIAPGSMSALASEIYQEGLRIPILKLFEGGRPNSSIFALMETNSRQPDKVRGDLDAQLAACAVAEKGFVELVRKYGADALRTYVDELHDYAERWMRADLEAIPDGTYRFDDYLDGFGDDPKPILFRVAVTITGSDMHVDWTGSSPQVKAAINGPIPITWAIAYLAARLVVNPGIPTCAGFMRPVTLTAPPGTIVNPVMPAACAARGIMAYRMLDALLGALVQAAPEKLMAASEGGPSVPTIAGWDDGKAFVLSDVLLGSWGARHNLDGLEGVPNPGTNCTNQPVELIESEYPVEIVELGFVPNSGGPGRTRGGLALVKEYKLRCNEATLIMRSDRRNHLPYGLNGGGAGTPSWSIFNPGREGECILAPTPMEALRMAHGDSIRHISPGAGGNGDPLDREPALVLEDVLDEKVTPDYAEAVYGVVIREGAIDIGATLSTRNRLRQQTHRIPHIGLFLHRVGVPREAWRPA